MKTLVNILIVMLLSQVWGCRKKDCCYDATNPACENYDPCLGKETVNTYFTIRDGDNGFPAPEAWCLDRITFSDTVLNSSIVLKVPKDNLNSTYEWQIGQDNKVYTKNEFEISFDKELQANGWERSFEITLIIRTPNSICLTNKNDTLIKVTRNVFFTQKTSVDLKTVYGIRKYEGYFSFNPSVKASLHIIYNDSNMFRGQTPGNYWLVVGLPNVDTLMLPRMGCGYQRGCGSYTHSYIQWENTNVCSWVDLTKHITHYETIREITTGKETLRFRSVVKSHEFYYEFKGKEI